MPQVDLSPLFPPPSQPEPPPPSPTPLTEVDPAAPASPPLRRFRLSAAQWTNLAFVVCACLGALLSGVYLFKGELLQEVAAWPRELFQGRAVAPARPAPNQLTMVQTGPSIEPVSGSETDNSGDPFSSVSKSLKLDRFSVTPGRPNGAAVNPFSTTSSVLPDGVGSTTTPSAAAPPVVVPPNSVPPPPAATSTVSTAADTAQAAASSTAATLQQPNGLTKAADSAVSKVASARSFSGASRVATRAANRSTRAGATTAGKPAKASFFRSLFSFRAKRTAASMKTSSATNRFKPRRSSHLAKASKQVGAGSGSPRLRVTPSVKINTVRRSLGKVSAQKSVTQKGVSPKDTGGSALTFDSSSHIPQRAGAPTPVGSSSRTGINAGAAGAFRSLGSSSFTRPLGNSGAGIGGPGLGARLGHGLGRGGSR